MMAAPQTSLLLLIWFLCRSSSSPPCPRSCVCPRAQLLNCSSSGLSSVPRLTQDSVSELDLSHNLLSSVPLHQPHQSLKSVWLGDNSITYLSLCVDRNPTDRFLRRRPRTGSRARCQTWAPALQLLSAERNLLEQLPAGLDGVESLQVLQLSFNRISTLQTGVLRHLRQLKELHLQHNLLVHLHPQMFQHLHQLRVLDLSFNMLTSLHPVTHLTLHSIGMDVRLGGNRWQCDCSMHRLQRRIGNDHSRGLQNWNIVCSSPSTISGRDLLQLEEKELNCLNTENRSHLHQDVTVYSGSEILLPCSVQDSIWWTPRGQASVSQHNADLLIHNVSEGDTGLYVCVSEDDQVVSVFNLQISKPGGARKPRSLPRTELMLPQVPLNMKAEKSNSTQSDLVLAVCLSVFITFLFAFILGVLLRPYIDVLCKRVTNKKSPSAANSVPTVEQGQYVNEAFSSAEEPEDPPFYRERRVTFSTEENNVQYFDTVVSGDSNSDAVFEDEVVVSELYNHTNRDLGSEHLLQRGLEDKQSDDSPPGDSNESHIRNKEFEHIPEPDDLRERRSRSSSSDSSLSGKLSEEEQITKRKPTKSKSPQLVEDSLQQRLNISSKIEDTQISKEGKNKIPKRSSKSVNDCSLNTNIRNPLDSDDLHDNEELFDFSDSAQSPTTGSSNVFDSLNNPKQSPSLDQQKMEDMSSSSSYVSENEPTHYTVNSDPESEPDDSNGVQIQRVEPVKHSNYTRRSAERYYSFSSDSSESDKESMQNKRRRTSKEGTELKAVHHRHQNRDRSDVRAQTLPSDFSSSDESLKEEMERRTGWTKVKVSQPVSPDSSTQWPLIDLRHIPRIRRRLEIKATSPACGLTFNNDTKNKTYHMNNLVQEEIYGSNLPIKISPNSAKEPESQWPAETQEGSDTSSSSDSEDETGYNNKHEQQELHTRPTIKVSQKVPKEPENHWPALNLDRVTRIKRRLDIKGPSLSHDTSSSSDSEDETGHINKREQQKLHTTRPPIKVPQTVIKEPENRWPALNLERVTRIKRRLDIKGPPSYHDSSSSSDSEDETGHTNKHEQQELHTTRPPIKVSQTVSKEPENRWPALNLERVIRIKRRLDIKGPPHHDSSSSSDSEDETGHINKHEQQELHTTRHPIKVPQTVIKEPENDWPALNLERVTRIKRRLDIKGPPPFHDSSSSSDSEDETHHLSKQVQKEIYTSRPPIKVPQTVSKEPENRWPALNLERVTRIKRRLDIKGPPSYHDSSSSSDGEDETGHINKQVQQELHTRPPIKVPQTVIEEPENDWPALNLERVIRIKRRLDIKGPPSYHDSSSSSDSEEETGHINKHEQQELHTTRPPIKVSQTVSKEPENRWPALNLEQVTRIKRRLDIKGPPSYHDSSSSSDGEDETGHIKKHEQQELHTTSPPIKVPQTVIKEPENDWPALNLERVIRIKRRLDIKGPTRSHDSSSSSDSEDETGHINKHEQQELHTTRPPIKVPQTVTKEPENQWPALNFQRVTRIKRRLDIKGPSPSHDSSTSSDSEDETRHINKQEQQHTTRPQVKVSQTVNKEPENQWPALNLERVTRIKRRLDIKGPPTSYSSLSSDNGNKTTSQLQEHVQQTLHVSRPPNKVSETVTKEPENQWPAIVLERVTQIKRRLDIKGPLVKTDSPSSSDSENETGHLDKQEQHTRPPINISQNVTKEPENQWPAINLEQVTQIKRRLDIKGPQPSRDSSTSSDSEDETGHINKLEQHELHTRPPIKVSQPVSKEPEIKWPALNLERVTRIKRRLDIKGPPTSYSSFSSDNGNKATSQLQEQVQQSLHVSRPPNKISETVTKEPENQWPAIVLERVTQIKRRLDIKGPPVRTDSPSSSDSEDEKGHISKQGQQELHTTRPPIKVSQTVSKEPENRWPALNLERVTRIKRRLDIKGPPPYHDSSSSSDSEDETGHLNKHEQQELHTTRPPIKISQTVSKEPENQWPALNLERVTRIKRRLDIKGPSPRPDSSSSSDSEDEATGNVSRPGMESSAVLTSEKMFTMSPGVLVKNISHTPKKDHNIILEKYEVISDDLENQPTNTACSTPEITPELQTRWATMNLGISRFRRRLEITSPTTKPPNLPFSPPPDFKYSSSNENAPERQPRLQRRIVGMQELVLTDSSFVPENIPENRSPILKDPHEVSFPFEVKASLTETDKTKADTMLVDLSSQDIKRYKDIWVDEKTFATTSQHHSSSSSDSEDETRSPRVPDIKKYLNIKAPSPEPSYTQAFFSQGEKDGTKYSEMQSRQTLTDESLITYKRSIIKTSSLPKNSFTPAVDHTFISQKVDSDRNTSHSPRLDTSMSFDDRPTNLNANVALQREIRWMGVGNHLSGFSTANPASMNAVLPSLQQVSLTEPHSLSFEAFSSTSDKMQDSGKLDSILMNKYSSLDSESASPSSIGTFDLLGISPASEDKKEKKGLGALKVMSLERRLWEKDSSKDPSLPSDDSGSQDDNFIYSQFEKDTKISSEEPVKPASSSSLDKKRDADLLLLYGIPRYIRHDIKAPVQDTVPESPLPDD